jgi:hypothetical protein
MLSKSAEAYVRMAGRDDEAGQQQLLDICSTLARILALLLEAEDKWSRYKWVDSILPIAVTVPSAGELNIRGKMIWGERQQTAEWSEPFSTWVQIPSGQDGLRFKILCGDALRGLGTAPYSTSPRRDSLTDPQEWLFSFSESSGGTARP